MPPDLWSLYRMMLSSRLFEEAVTYLWKDGLISAEMHLGTGEEAICAGIVDQLQPGDAMALDHRGTPPLLMRGVDPLLILRELLGKPDGLCGGKGGHMHLFSKAHLAAASGIVGAAGPTAAGFALSAQMQRPGAVAVAFFGEGALNQGMLMEAFNLATTWKLPVLFVCKDDNWAITTTSQGQGSASPAERARAFGLPVFEVDGREVEDVWLTAGQALIYIRSGEGAAFLHARCVHLEGHFLGYQLLRAIRHPLREIPPIAGPMLKSFIRPGGAAVSERLAGVGMVLGAMRATLQDPRRLPENDPILRTRQQLNSDMPRLLELEARLEANLKAVIGKALQEDAR